MAATPLQWGVEVSGLFVYPVKSLRGIALERSAVGLRGLRHDRHWMVVNENGRFRTQRQIPKMAQVSTGIEDGLVLSVEGGGRIVAPFEPQGPAMEATVWGWTGAVDLVDPQVDRWLSNVLEAPCRLVAMRGDMDRRSSHDAPVAFPDGHAVLVVGEASLAGLNERLDEPVPMDRFRPNVVVRGSGAYAEDGWSTIQIGSVDLEFAKRCGRCVVTTMDQRTGVGHPREEPLRTLARERLFDQAACFGAYYAPRGEGVVSVGDVCEVDLSRAK